ncbi:uncharacterized protein LOC119919413 [Tachyglossus aculeatus]|uniref:uncharacterized protein LOC119919413 n=1 Tax=Tachyglossus aculeatus TaxID=9261 RepID=UPI0018F3D055|nr:uncharacterized protein LOC119919413 [Tachyglossus aculeatus]
MDQMLAFLSPQGLPLSDLNDEDLQNLVPLLSCRVTEEEAALSLLEDEVLHLQEQIAESAAERARYVSITAQLAPPPPSFWDHEEQRPRGGRDPPQQEPSGPWASNPEHPAGEESEAAEGQTEMTMGAETETTLASLRQREEALRREKQQLLEHLEVAQAALSQAQGDWRAAKAQLARLEKEQYGATPGASGRKSGTDRKLDARIRELKILEALTEKQ